ncbi:MAG TPA: hypothetical protein VGZ23_09590 [bacterium]|nr:hypothetical protein [bacterium]
MTEWQVHFEFAHALSFDRMEDLMLGDLAPYHAVTCGGDGYDTSSVTMTVEADTAASAFEVAWQAVTRAEPFTPEEVLEFDVRPMPGPDDPA